MHCTYYFTNEYVGHISVVVAPCGRVPVEIGVLVEVQHGVLAHENQVVVQHFLACVVYYCRVKTLSDAAEIFR